MKIVNIKRAAVAAVSLTALLAVSACSGGGAEPTSESSGGGGGDSGYTFAMITHETPGDTFWDRIRAGAEQAAKDTGSTLKYSADPEASKQAVLIQNAIDSKVDGIATTLVTPDALIPTVKKAVAAGIPVDSFNSGTNFYQQAGALAHFSSDERLAGQQAGAKAKADGATKILCTIQQTGSVALEDRCAGVKDAFPNTENIQVNGEGRLRGHLGDPGQAGPGQGHQLDHHPRCGSGGGRSQGQGRCEKPGQDRNIRSEQGGGGGGEGRERSSSASTSSRTCRATWLSPSSTSTRRTATSSAAASRR